MTLGYISVVILFIGIFLVSAFLFWIPFLGFLGISFLVFFGVVVALVRRKMSIVKRKNHEVIEAMNAEGNKNREKERIVGLKDLPPWLITLLAVVVAVWFIGELGIFNPNPLLETLLLILVILFLIYYYLYKRRARDKKHGVNSGSLSLSIRN